MNEHKLQSTDLLWLSLALLFLITLSFLFTIQPQDYWWCLRVGEETLANNAVPTVETLSWSQAGQPILYEPWLSCVIFKLIFDLGGASSTFLLRGLLIGLTYGVIWLMARQTLRPQWATVLVLVMGLAGSNNWEVRAQLLAYPLFLFFLYSLFNWQTGNNKFLWVFPAAIILWANLHGSYILGFVLVGSALVFGSGHRKPLFVVLILMLAGSLVTPHGFSIWEHLHFMLTVPSNQEYSLEWSPPVNLGWQMNIFFAWVLLFAPLAVFSPRKISLMEWIWFLGFGWLAFSGTRYVIWFLFILVMLTARLLGGVLPDKQERPVQAQHPAFNRVLSCLLILLSLFYLPGIRENWWIQSPDVYAPDSTPIKATDWLIEHPEIPGPMWNDYAFGSYLAYAIPSRPVWLDSRFFPFSSGQMEEYVQISRGSPAWESMFQREGINLLILSTHNQPKLIERVETSGDWCGEYRDDDAVIYSRCEPLR